MDSVRKEVLKVGLVLLAFLVPVVPRQPLLGKQNIELSDEIVHNYEPSPLLGYHIDSSNTHAALQELQQSERVRENHNREFHDTSQ